MKSKDRFAYSIAGIFGAALVLTTILLAHETSNSYAQQCTLPACDMPTPTLLSMFSN